MSDKFLYVRTECNVDTNVVSYLMHGVVNHQQCCSQVVQNLKEHSDEFAVGIIDNDKKLPVDLSNFNKIASSDHLCVWKHHELNHYMITVDPAMDGFIWDCAKAQKVKPKDFNLPSQFKAFKKRMKKKTSNNDPDIRSFVKAISDNKELDALRKLLSYLKDNKYKAEYEVITNILC